MLFPVSTGINRSRFDSVDFISAVPREYGD